MALILDVVEVPKSHSGITLANAFSDILKEFGLEHKVNTLLMLMKLN
jgi:hypothetical protein